MQQWVGALPFNQKGLLELELKKIFWIKWEFVELHVNVV